MCAVCKQKHKQCIYFCLDLQIHYFSHPQVRQVRNVKRSAPTQGPVSISSSADTYEGDIPPSPSFLPTSRGSATPSQLAEDIYLTTIPEDAESSGQHGEGGGKTLVVVLSSDDRLELTVSPGAIQTLQDVVNVSDLRSL